jgi:hypothetical protein
MWSAAGFRLKTRVRMLCNEWTSYDGDELKYRGRDLLEELAWIVATISLITDALKDNDEVAVEIAKRWSGGSNHESLNLGETNWKNGSRMDKKIVFGVSNEQARL